MGEHAIVEIHSNLPGCAFLAFPSFQIAESFAEQNLVLPLSSKCKARVESRPIRNLPAGAEAVTIDGLSDIGETPTALLLLRHIPPNLSELGLFDWFLRDLGLDLMRILMIRRKDMFAFSAGIAFAEFKSIDLASKALHILEHFNHRAPNTSQNKLLRGIKASYVSMGAFEIASYPFQHTFRSSGGVMLQYSNFDYFVSEYPKPSDTESTEDTSVEIPDPANSGQQQITNPLFNGSKKRKAIDTGIPSSVREKHQKWQQKHAELIPKKAASSSITAPPLDSKSYADHIRLNCYLCDRHFTSSEKLNTHERVSALHQYYLEFDKERLERAGRIREALKNKPRS